MMPVRRYGALEMLVDHLNRSRGSAVPYGLNPEMNDSGAALLGYLEQPRQLPSGLPDAVQRSILGQPSYGEGQIMAPRPWYNPAFDETENMLPLDSPMRRENRLNDKVGFGQYLRRQELTPIPEGGWLSMGDRGFADPFPSPLNQMLRRGPFALY